MSPGAQRSAADPPAPLVDAAVAGTTQGAPRPGQRSIFSRAGGALLILLGALLPFEAPLLRVGSLTLTTVELVLYALLLAWGADLLSPQRPSRGGYVGAVRDAVTTELRALGASPFARAVALWLGVVAVAAAAAPAHRIEAAKFALRTASGGLLFGAAFRLTRAPGVARALVTAIVVGAVVSAAAGMVELAVPASEALWRPFRPAVFSVTGLPRPSGPFGYPTIAAMYWEAVLPLVVLLPFVERGRKGAARRAGPGWGTTLVALAAVAILLLSVLLSATRTALAVSAIASLALVVSQWRGGKKQRVATVGTGLLVVALTGIALASPGAESPLGMRLRFWNDSSWYRVEYGADARKLTLAAGSHEELPLTIKNIGRLTWPHAGAHAVYVAYHWERSDAGGTHLDFEGLRTPLPGDVSPGTTVSVQANVLAPTQPGHYRLRWDLVREGVTWFSSRRNPTGDREVDVTAGSAGATGTTYRRAGTHIFDSTLEELMHWESPSRPRLWRAALVLALRHPLLGVGPDNFRRLYPQAISPPLQPGTIVDTRLHANSLYFETAADLGIAGLLALALLIAVVVRGARAWRTAPPLALGATIAAGTFFVHGFLDYFFEFTPTYALFFLMLALAAAARPAPAND